MNFDEFVTQVKDRVKDFLPEEIIPDFTQRIKDIRQGG